MKRSALLSILISVVYFGSVFSQETHFVYPADAEVLDVTKPPFNADNTGSVDATGAIQAALSKFPSGNRTIYLPNGTYLISNTLHWPEGSGGGTHKRTMIQGESKDGVIIRLQDHCPGYQDPSNRKAMIYTGPAPAQRFRNAIRGITVNTGTGNPGAAGIQFNCSNEGTVQHVNIISGDGQGTYGLDLDFTNEIGPGYIYDLTVEGFDYGVRHGYLINSMTFEKITLRNQHVCAFWNGGNVSMIRGLVSENNVTAVKNLGRSGTMILIDADLNSSSDTATAIYNTGVLYARNITRTGYDKTIDSENGLKIDMDDPSIKEYNSHKLYRQFPSPVTSLNLPVKDWPEVPWADTTDWVNVLDHGAYGDNSHDDAAAIQAAIDAGKSTVYFPGGYKFKIDDTIRIRGSVQRLIGCETSFSGTGTFVVEDGIPDTVVFERMTAIYSDVTLINRTSRTFMINSVSDLPLVSEGSGDLYLVNFVAGTMRFNNPDEHIWGRQLNPESGDFVNIENNGATLWIMGLKTERGQTKIYTRDGGKTELLGSHNYSTSSTKVNPWFVVEDGSLSVAGARETNYNGNTYKEYITEIRDGESRTLDHDDFPASGAGGGSVIPLYNGYQIEGTLPDSPENLTFTHEAPGLWKVLWDTVRTAEFDYYSVYMSETQGGPYEMTGNYIKEPGFIFEPEEYGTYYFVVTAVNKVGLESVHSTELAGEVPMPEPPAAPSGLTAVNYGDSILISWDPNTEPEFDHYEIYRALPPGSFFLPLNTNLQDTSYIDKALTAGNTYYYYVQAVNIFDAKSENSDTLIVYPLGIEEAGMPNGLISVYPNPVRTELNIGLPASINAFTVTILDARGKKILSRNFQSSQAVISMEGYKPGIYFVKVTANNKSGVSRFVLTR